MLSLLVLSFACAQLVCCFVFNNCFYVSMHNNCNRCCKSILHFHDFITCSSCKSDFHTRCIYTDIVDHWFCFNCGTLFPFNHYVDDDEFKYALFCFDNSIDYNNLLDLRLNPFHYDNVLHDADNNLLKFNAIYIGPHHRYKKI